MLLCWSLIGSSVRAESVYLHPAAGCTGLLYSTTHPSTLLATPLHPTLLLHFLLNPITRPRVCLRRVTVFGGRSQIGQAVEYKRCQKYTRVPVLTHPPTPPKYFSLATLGFVFFFLFFFLDFSLGDVIQ